MGMSMPICFDAAGLLLGSILIMSAMTRGRWGQLALGTAILGLACFGIGVKL